MGKDEEQVSEKGENYLYFLINKVIPLISSPIRPPIIPRIINGKNISNKLWKLKTLLIEL